MTSVLRLILDGPASGAWNMAVDEALATSLSPSSPLTLRFYRWSRPTVSLGHHQPLRQISTECLRRRNVDLVRRPTGGMAVLHDEEITIALAGRAGSSWPGSLGDMVALLSASLARALWRWEVRAHTQDARPPLGSRETPLAGACFSGGGRHEVWVGSRKIAGLAARRWGRSFLVHGSLLIGRAHLGLADVLAGSPQERRAVHASLLERTVCLADLMGELPTVEDITAEATREVGSLAGRSVVPGALDTTEKALAARLCQERFGDGKVPCGDGPTSLAPNILTDSGALSIVPVVGKERLA